MAGAIISLLGITFFLLFYKIMFDHAEKSKDFSHVSSTKILYFDTYVVDAPRGVPRKENFLEEKG